MSGCKQQPLGIAPTARVELLNSTPSTSPPRFRTPHANLHANPRANLCAANDVIMYLVTHALVH